VVFPTDTSTFLEDGQIITTTYTLGQMTDDLIQQLRGTTRDEINLLAGSIDAPASGTVESGIGFVNPLNGITIGSLLAVGTETMYVLNVDESANTAQVIRGFDDTTPVAAGANAQVIVDPPWPRALLQNRIRDEIRKWGPQVYGVANVQIPIVLWQRGYDLGAIVNPVSAGGLGATINRILLVTAPQPPYIGAPGFWFVPGSVDIEQANPSFPFRYQPNANPVEFPSGHSLILTGTALPTVTGNLNVIFATPFNVDTSWDDDTDMISDVGLDERYLDIPALGVTARLMRMIAVRRNMLNVQGQSQDDQAVTAASILQTAAQFKEERDNRLMDAQIQLLSDFPYRSSNY
jgi:hypothetical protein